MKTWWYFVLALVAGLIASAAPNDKGEAGGKVPKEPAKAPMETTRISRGNGVGLASGYRFVKLGANEVAIYRGNGATGTTMRCICPSGSAQVCELKPDPEGRGFYICDPHGCPDCQFQVTHPKGVDAIFREIKISTLPKKAREIK